MAVNLGSAAPVVHGDAYHSSTYVHLGGSVTETITGLKTLDRVLKVVDGAAASPAVQFTSEAAMGLYRASAGRLGLSALTSVDVVDSVSGQYASVGRDATSGGFVALGLTGTLDAFLYRDAAGVLALRNGATAQALRVYRTFTDASNYEHLTLTWSGTTAAIGTVHAGTGVARDLALVTGGSLRWTVDATAGHLTAGAATQQIRWGTAATEPMLKRAGVGLEVKLADDSDYTSLTAKTLSTTSSLNVASGAMEIAGAGPHYISTVGGSASTFLAINSLPSSAITRMLSVSGTLQPTAGTSAYLVDIAPTMLEAASGIHSEMMGLRVQALAVTIGAGAVTNAATFAITGAANAAGANNYALWVQAGDSLFRGNLLISNSASVVVPSVLLHVNDAATTLPAIAATTNTVFARNGLAAVAIIGTSAQSSNLHFGDEASETVGRIRYSHTDDSMQFQTNAAEAARLTSAGILLVGTTTDTNAAAGDIRGNGALWIKDGMTAPTQQAGFGVVYIDTADGDLKVKFADGITKTLATDT